MFYFGTIASECSIRSLRIQLRVPRKLAELALINFRQLRATQRAECIANCSIQLSNRTRHVRENTLKQIRSKVRCGLERKASQVIALQQGLCVVDTTRQVANVHTREGVDFASISADADELGIRLGSSDHIQQEERNSVLVAEGASVLVVGDALVAGRVIEVSG